MLISSAVFVLASYVGPVTSPDAYLNPARTRKQVERVERQQPGYNYPRASYQPPSEKPMTVREKAAKGRMVVPDKFL